MKLIAVFSASAHGTFGKCCGLSGSEKAREHRPLALERPRHVRAQQGRQPDQQAKVQNHLNNFVRYHVFRAFPVIANTGWFAH